MGLVGDWVGDGEHVQIVLDPKFIPDEAAHEHVGEQESEVDGTPAPAEVAENDTSDHSSVHSRLSSESGSQSSSPPSNGTSHNPQPNTVIPSSVDAALDGPVHLRRHAANPPQITRSIYQSIQRDDVELLQHLLDEVGIGHVLRHGMITWGESGTDQSDGQSQDGKEKQDQTEAVHDGSEKRKKDAKEVGRRAPSPSAHFDVLTPQSESEGTAQSDRYVSDGTAQPGLQLPQLVGRSSSAPPAPLPVQQQLLSYKVGAEEGKDQLVDSVRLENGLELPSKDKQDGHPHHRPLRGRTLFHLAAYHGSAAVMDLLCATCLSHFRSYFDEILGNGREQDLTSTSGKRGLEPADRVLRQLLNTSTRHGSTPLHIAAYLNHGEVVEVLIRYGADPNMVNGTGSTAAIIAASRNAVMTLRALGKAPSQSGVDFNRADGEGNGPIHAACLSSALDALRYLFVEYPANLRECRENEDASDESTGEGAESVADIDYRACNNAGFGCAALAARNDRPEVIRFLDALASEHPNMLDQRVDSIQEEDSFNLDPPLVIATKFNSVDAVRAFLQSSSCDVDARNVHGQTALHLAVSGNRVEVVQCYECLSPEQFEVFDTDDVRGMTPLYLACSLGHTDIVQILAPMSNVEVMCLVEEEGPSYPSQQPSRRPSADNVESDRTLERATGSINLCPSEEVVTATLNRSISQPPLLAAVRSNHIDCVSILLSHGVDVNQTSDGGHSALAIAARSGYLELCQLLLSAGADPTLRSHRGGGTALQKARKYRHGKVVELLEKQEMMTELAGQQSELDTSDHAIML